MSQKAVQHKKRYTLSHLVSMAAVIAISLSGVLMVGGASAQSVSQEMNDSTASVKATGVDTEAIHKPSLISLNGYNASSEWTKTGLKMNMDVKVASGDVKPNCVGLATGDDKIADGEGRCGLQLFIGNRTDANGQTMMRRITYINTLGGKDADQSALKAASDAWSKAAGDFFTIQKLDTPKGQTYDSLSIALKTSALDPAEVKALHVYAVINDGNSHEPIPLSKQAVNGDNAEVVIPNELMNSDYVADLMAAQTLNPDGLSWCGDASSITCVADAKAKVETKTSPAAPQDSSTAAPSTNVTLGKVQPVSSRMLNYVSRIEVPGGALRMDFVLRVPRGSIELAADAENLDLHMKFSPTGKSGDAVSNLTYVPLTKTQNSKKGTTVWAETTNDQNVYTIHSVTPVRTDADVISDPIYDDVSISVKAKLNYSAQDVNANAVGGTQEPLYVYAVQGNDPGQPNVESMEAAHAFNVSAGDPVRLYSSAACDDADQACNGPRLATGTDGFVKPWWDPLNNNKTGWKGNNGETSKKVRGQSANWGLDLREGFSAADTGYGDDADEGYAPMSVFNIGWKNPALPKDHDPNGNGSSTSHPCSQVSGYWFQWVGLDKKGNWQPVTSLTPHAQYRSQVPMGSPTDGELGQYSAYNNKQMGSKKIGNNTYYTGDFRGGTWTEGRTDTNRESSAQHEYGKIDFAEVRQKQPDLNGYFKLVTWPVSSTPDSTKDGASCSASANTTADQDILNPLGYTRDTSNKTLGLVENMNQKDAQTLLDKGWSVDSAFYGYDTVKDAPTLDSPSNGTQVYDTYAPKLEGHARPGASLEVYRISGESGNFSAPGDDEKNGNWGTKIQDQQVLEGDNKNPYTQGVDVKADEHGNWSMTDTKLLVGTYSYRVRESLPGHRNNTKYTDFSQVKSIKVVPVDHSPQLFKMLNYNSRMDTLQDKLRMDFMLRVGHGDVDVLQDENANRDGSSNTNQHQNNISVIYDYRGDGSEMRMAKYSPALSEGANHRWANAWDNDDRFAITAYKTSGAYDYLTVSIKADLAYKDDPDDGTLGGIPWTQHVYVTVDKDPSSISSLRGMSSKDRLTYLKGKAKAYGTNTIDIANTPDADDYLAAGEGNEANAEKEHADANVYGYDACGNTSGCAGPRLAYGPLTRDPVKSGNYPQTWTNGSSNWGVSLDNGFNSAPEGQKSPGTAPANTFWNMWYDPAYDKANDPYGFNLSGDWYANNGKLQHKCAQVSGYYFQWLGLNTENKWVPVADLTPTAQYRSQNPLASWEGDPWKEFSSDVNGDNSYKLNKHNRQFEYAARNSNDKNNSGYENEHKDGEIRDGKIVGGSIAIVDANNKPIGKTVQDYLMTSDKGFVVPKQLRQNIMALDTDPATGGIKIDSTSKSKDYPFKYAPAQNSNGSINFLKAKEDQKELTGYFKMVSWPVTTTNINGVTSECTDNPDTYNPLGNPDDTKSVKGVTEGMKKLEAQKLIDKGWSNNSASFKYDVPRPVAPSILDPKDGATVSHISRTISGTGIPGATLTLYSMKSGSDNVDDATVIGKVTVGADKKWSLTDTRYVDDYDEAQRTFTYRATQSDPFHYHTESDWSNSVTVHVDPGKPNKPDFPIDANGEMTGLTVPHTVNGRLLNTDGTHKKVVITGTQDDTKGDVTVHLYAQPLKDNGDPVSEIGANDDPHTVCATDESAKTAGVVCGKDSVPADGNWKIELDATQFLEPDRSPEASGKEKLSEKYTKYRIVAQMARSEKDKDTGKYTEVAQSAVTSTTKEHPAIIDMRAPVVTITSAKWNSVTGTARHATPDGDEAVPNGSKVVATWYKYKNGTSGEMVANGSSQGTVEDGKWTVGMPDDVEPGKVSVQVTDTVQPAPGNQSKAVESNLDIAHLSNLPMTGGWRWVLIGLLFVVLLAVLYKFTHKAPQLKHSMKSIRGEEYVGV
ncbi:hypothetical protein [Bifidobacterium sp. ESL0704]|uniref:hypothetical protein n=1 Tax=Bifidobacterium sp. ESL0704 TaxID=2983219 RepID=UPI0023F7C74B|nr:hypothetical protein [Bifidobacterium sp. ESL0704]WEV53004.1 hypothetical protein OZX64_00380 [Bifidobacterium sp. ESL0704]